MTATTKRGKLDHIYQTIDGWFWFENAYRRLLDTLPVDVPSTFVEVGCFRGRSLAFLAVEVYNRFPLCTIHAVDWWKHRPVQEEFTANIKPLVAALGLRLQVWDMASSEAAALIPDASCDVIWLDGDHSLQFVRLDIASWLPKLKVGGWMGGDDWLTPDVQQAVYETFPVASVEIGLGTMQPGESDYPWWLVQKGNP